MKTVTLFNIPYAIRPLNLVSEMSFDEFESWSLFSIQKHRHSVI